MNIRTLHLGMLALAALSAIPQASVQAQTITTPPRTISSQQETQGSDSTLTLVVVNPNNTGTSYFTVPIPNPSTAGYSYGTPPTLTCYANSVTTKVTQTATCPSGHVTTAGMSSFVQTATQTVTTTCPNGNYGGSPSTTTSTSAWSPTATAACSVVN